MTIPSTYQIHITLRKEGSSANDAIMEVLKQNPTLVGVIRASEAQIEFQSLSIPRATWHRASKEKLLAALAPAGITDELPPDVVTACETINLAFELDQLNQLAQQEALTKYIESWLQRLEAEQFVRDAAERLANGIAQGFNVVQVAAPQEPQPTEISIADILEQMIKVTSEPDRFSDAAFEKAIREARTAVDVLRSVDPVTELPPGSA